jgi:FMN phosphatase YigB (HAD superfamily)
MSQPSSLFSRINCVVFDFGFTLCPDFYFNVAPPEYPHWQQIFQQRIFANKDLVDCWMVNEVTTADIAAVIAQEVDLDLAEIIEYMQEGCKNLSFNPALMQFALAQRSFGRKTALVTANMDIFTQIVVPAHGLDTIFDMIINSADYGEINKEHLWPLAFRQLGKGIGYANSVLIEDSRPAAERFRQLGGLAYRYTGDDAFLGWLTRVG